MEIIDRDSARAAGLKRFFIGEPCSRGHISERYVVSNMCVTCRMTVYEEVNARYKRANPEKVAEWQRNKYERNKHKYIANQSEYRKVNKEKVNAWNRSRKSQQKLADGKFTPADTDRIFKEQRGKCAYCRESIKKEYHIDHIIAISNGGSNNARNIQLLCPQCNMRKRSKDPIMFARENGMLL